MELCKTTGIPASTLSDILSGKAELTHCQARTIQKFSHGIGLSMDELMELDSLARSVPEKNESGRLHKLCSPDIFRAFRGDLLDVLQHVDEETFIYAAAQNEFVESMYEAGLCPQALYSLGLIDYLCDKHRIPRLEQYNKYRTAFDNLSVDVDQMISDIRASAMMNHRKVNDLGHNQGKNNHYLLP